MTHVLLIYHNKLQMLIPVGGKREYKDRDMQDTGNRETAEEAGLALFPGTGVFLDRNGEPTDEQPVIHID